MLDERLLVIGQRLLVEVSPAAFVEVEGLGLGDGGAGVGLPGQRAQAGVVADSDRRGFCCWSVEDRDDEVKSECGCNVDVGADRDRGVARVQLASLEVMTKLGDVTHDAQALIPERPRD